MKTIGVQIAPSSKTVLLFPFSKQCLLLKVVIKLPMATLNVIVINSLLTKECVAFSNVSVFGVHLKTDRFQNARCQIYAFSLAFSKSSVFTAEQCECTFLTRSFTRFNMNTEQC